MFIYNDKKHFLKIFLILFTCLCNVFTHCPTSHHINFEDDEYWDRNYLQCEYASLNPVIAINNYKNVMVVEYKPFSSACAQCAICLTIAAKFDRLFQSFHKNHATNIRKENEINGKIKKFCDIEFQNFDFRNDNCLCSITNDYKYTNQVMHSNEAGLWPVKLKEMCHNYVDVAGEYDLYKRWFENYDSLNFVMSDILCRSYGLFQHCRNVLSDE